MTETDLNVLLVAGRFEVRGSSAYTLRLAENLPDFGIRPRIICPDASRIEPERRADLPLRQYRQWDRPLVGSIIGEFVRRDLLDKPPDLIHLQSKAALGIGTRLARQLGCPFVLTIHDYLPPRRRLILNPRLGRKIIAVSRSVKADLLDRTNLTDDAITVIHSGVETRAVEAPVPVLKSGHQPVVGTAGPLESVKGLPYFLGAAQRVLEQRPEVQFLIAGAGPEEQNLRRLARELKIAHSVTFVSSLYDYAEAIAAMDIFCLPSLQQGLGTIMLEAMALKRPVIATGVGGVYSAVQNGETGLVVPPSDSAALAQQILALLNNPEKAQAIGAAAAELVRQEFDVHQMVERTAAVYRAAVANAVPATV